MIDKLRKRFVFLGTTSIFILLSILITIINIGNYQTVVSEIDRTIDVLRQPNNPFFDIEINNEHNIPRDFEKEFQPFLPRGMSIEVPYESRFFTIEIENNKIVDKDISRIISLNEEDIESFVKSALKNNNEKGFVDSFRYKKTTIGNKTNIIFFDSGRKLETFYNFLRISILFGLLGCVISFVIFIIVSKKVVKPISENYDKQKRFITDAGHEIKTPLTIINANIDLIESEYGNNESIDDIKEQIVKLKDLTNDLVYLSSAEEKGNINNKDEISLSDLIYEIIDDFNKLIVLKNILLKTNIQDNIKIKGSTNEIKKFVSILLDNSIKYSNNQGEINIDLYLKKKMACLEVKNTYDGNYNGKEFKDIFERFYRTDSSRNSETGGSGIGLSIAKAIVESHKGTIEALNKDEKFTIIAKFNSI